MTKEEMKKLLNELYERKQGSDHNALVSILNHLISEAEKPKERWRAAGGGEYWFASSDGEVTHGVDNNCVYNNKHYSIGNYYRTEGEAKDAAERVRKAYVVE